MRKQFREKLKSRPTIRNQQLRKEEVSTDCRKGDCRNIVVQGSLQKGICAKERCRHHFTERSLQKVNCGKTVCKNKNVESSLQNDFYLRKGRCENAIAEEFFCRKVVVERKLWKVLNNEFK